MLEVRSLRTFYGKRIEALQGVSLKVNEGDIVSLIGANGAGKTTLLKTLCGILHPDSGEVHFQGERIDGRPSHEIVRLGVSMVPEGRKIFPRLTVKENLEMGAYTLSNGKREEGFERAFSLFPILKERLRQKGGTLSGGEQQMLAIARALASQPRLLLLDEPSMGLSPILVEKVFGALEAINSQGVTLLLVEQNAAKALGLCQRGYVLETGRIVLTDTGGNLLNNPLVQKAYLGN